MSELHIHGLSNGILQCLPAAVSGKALGKSFREYLITRGKAPGDTPGKLFKIWCQNKLIKKEGSRKLQNDFSATLQYYGKLPLQLQI